MCMIIYVYDHLCGIMRNLVCAKPGLYGGAGEDLRNPVATPWI